MAGPHLIFCPPVYVYADAYARLHDSSFVAVIRIKCAISIMNIKKHHCSRYAKVESIAFMTGYREMGWSTSQGAADRAESGKVVLAVLHERQVCDERNVDSESRQGFDEAPQPLRRRIKSPVHTHTVVKAIPEGSVFLGVCPIRNRPSVDTPPDGSAALGSHRAGPRSTAGIGSVVRLPKPMSMAVFFGNTISRPRAMKFR